MAVIPRSADDYPSVLPRCGVIAACDRRWALAVGGVALLLRFLYFQAFRVSPLHGIFLTDHRYYRDWGLRIAGGDWIGHETFEQGPLYAYLLGVFYRLAGPRDDLVLLVQLLSGVGMVLLVFFCALRLFGRHSAIASGLLAAAYGPLVFHECQIMKTFLEPLLITAALFAALRYADTVRPRHLAAAGAGIGLLCLGREVHILLLPPLLAWAWLLGRRHGLPARRQVAHLGAAALAAACLIAPATVRNCLVAGDCVLVTSAGGEVLYLSYGPNASAYYLNPPFVRAQSRIEHEDFRDEARLRSGRNLSRGEASRYWREEAVRAALASPGKSLRLAARKLTGLLNDYEYPDSEDYTVTRGLIPLLGWLPSLGWVAGLGLLGAIFALRERPPPTLVPMFLAVCVLGVLLTQAFGRYRLVMTPLLLLLAGHALARLPHRIREATGRDLLGRAGGVLFAGVVTVWAFSPPPTIGGEGWVRWITEDFRKEVTVRSAKRADVVLLQQRLEAAPRTAGTWSDLGDALMVVGRLSEAERAYRRALELDPGLARTARALADLYFEEGRFDQAAARARAVVELEPGDPRSHLALAVFCSRLAIGARVQSEAEAQRGEAESHFREAARLSPRDASIYYYRGKFLALAGAAEAALIQLRTAVEIAPGFTEAIRVLDLVEQRRRSPAAPRHGPVKIT